LFGKAWKDGWIRVNGRWWWVWWRKVRVWWQQIVYERESERDEVSKNKGVEAKNEGFCCVWWLLGQKEWAPFLPSFTLYH